MYEIEKMYTPLDASDLEKKYPVIDLRSDTLTKPTNEMRLAMFSSAVGDDVYGEDPTVNELEEKAAELTGKEAGLFVPSGTMGNLIAIMVHCDVRGCEAYCGERSHTFLHEQGGAAQLAGVTLCPLPNMPDGSFDLSKLMSKLRKDRLHEPISKLVLVENTFNGNVVSQRWIEQLAELARAHDLRMHLDGARIWNAAVASERSVQDLVNPFDSVMFCLSKSLGAPIGSMLCGSECFIRKARRIRKVLGGGMRQAGIIAGAGLVSLKFMEPLLKYDHMRANYIAKEIHSLNDPRITVDRPYVDTNMVFINVRSDSMSSADFARRLREVHDDTEDDRVIVKCLPLTSTIIRLVFYHEINDAMTDKVIRKLRHVIGKIGVL